ncbi:MAG TPA: Lrp/AsnC family transcriptional regulator [Caldilineae bacterium]|nr:Lrp/AsnC family transcriptional regulator [Caldilineae bacterium]
MPNTYQTQTLDELDKSILSILQRDGRISNADLARRISLSQPATHARLRRLEERGYIDSYVALLDREQVGFDMLCFVRVSLKRHQIEHVEQFRAAVQKMPEVMECHFVTGDFDYLLKVVVRNRKELERFLVRKLTPAPGVARVYTNLVLSEVKSTTTLPLE